MYRLYVDTYKHKIMNACKIFAQYCKHMPGVADTIQMAVIILFSFDI